MGILRLSDVIKTHAPKSVQYTTVEKYRGWKVAIDASMVLYQTLIGIRTGRDTLTNKNGDSTSHIHGILYKTVVMIEKGIVPMCLTASHQH